MNQMEENIKEALGGEPSAESILGEYIEGESKRMFEKHSGTDWAKGIETLMHELGQVNVTPIMVKPILKEMQDFVENNWERWRKEIGADESVGILPTTLVLNLLAFNYLCDFYTTFLIADTLTALTDIVNEVHEHTPDVE